MMDIKTTVTMDMETKQRLMDGRGNAMLVCSSVYQACTTYEMFSHTDLAGKVAIVTSYQPTAASIKGEETGEGQTEKLFKYDIYRNSSISKPIEIRLQLLWNSGIFINELSHAFVVSITLKPKDFLGQGIHG